MVKAERYSVLKSISFEYCSLISRKHYASYKADEQLKVLLGGITAIDIVSHFCFQ